MTRALYVPVKVEALVVNATVLGGETFHRWQPDFTKVAYHQPVEPRAFEGEDPDFGNLENQGVYLHWQLPDALCRGELDHYSGQINFPYVPNRWLVVRHHRCDSEVRRTAWLVQSDYLGGDGTVPYPCPGQGKLDITNLGRVHQLGDDGWQEPAPAKLFLTSLGSGLHTFAAFQPYHQDVFSLHDPLTGVDPKDRHNLGYLVVGWYSHDDAVAGWTPEKFTRYRWTLRDQDLADLLKSGISSFYVGGVLKVTWPDGKAPDSDKPDGDTVKVAVGATGIDAFAELLCHPDTLKDLGVKSSNLTEADLEHDTLTAVHHGLLDALTGDSDGSLRYAQHIHQSAFAPYPAGYLWRLRDSGDVPQELGELNAKQARYEEQVRVLRALRTKLRYYTKLADFADRFPESVPTRFDDPGIFRRQLPSLKDAVVKQQEVVETLRRQLPYVANPQDRLLGEYAGKVIAVPRPPYARAIDPVVVLAGAHPGAADPPTPIRCRLADELPQENPALGFLFLTGLPQAVRQPLVEFTRLYDGDEGHEASSLLYPVWRQPWSPLFLEWEVDFVPIPYTKQNWVFDGTDYRLRTEFGAGGSRITVRGRQLLSTHLSRTLDSQVQRYLDHHPELTPDNRQPMKQVLFTARRLDPISQTLAGLTDALARRVPPTGPTPGEKSKHDSFEVPAHDLDPGAAPAPGADWVPSGYQDIRAGQFVFTRLAVVDTFGRSCNVIIRDQVLQAQVLVPPDMRAEGEAIAGASHRLVELRPRLAQPARFRFDLVAADDDDKLYQEHAHDPTATPICGWILPNYLDRSLLCFAPDGRPLVEMRAVAGTNGRQAATAPLPGFPADTLDGVNDPTLRHLAKLIRDTTGEVDRFDELDGAIHRLLPSIDPAHPEPGHHHANLCGRPLALVRVRIRLDLDGPTLTDPGWESVYQELVHKQPPVAGFTQHSWPIRIGETNRLADGLIGYYAYENMAQEQKEEKTPLIAVDAPSPLRVQLNGPATHLTLLMDPYAAVHAATGILPISTLRLPDTITRKPLSALRVSFRLGPLLTTVRENRVVLPLPPNRTGRWQWAETHTSNHDWQFSEVTRADTTVRLPDNPLVLRAGFLHRADPDTSAPHSEPHPEGG